LLDSQNQLVGFVARTLPQAKDVVGYRGPTEAVIVFDPTLQIVSVRLLHSADTEEHVAAVRNDAPFTEQFVGWPWGGPSQDTRIDGVSGATLTSLAMAEGVLKRIGGARQSLVFDEPLQPTEVQDWFPEAAAIDEETGTVQDASGRSLGKVIRTGPHSDNLVGYQGPSELLIKLSADNCIDDVRIRESLDNEPYVGYIRDEAKFWKLFRGKTLTELAKFDPAEAGVEGVSGATMSSLVIADTLVASANSVNSNQNSNRNSNRSAIRWTNADFATMGLLVTLAVLRKSHWFRKPAWRRGWLIGTILVVGLWAGNLISLALVAGWSAEGVAWRLAPGLAAVAAISLISPALTKSNPYCNHLCPHGAVQQLIKPSSRSRRRIKPSPQATQWLARIPGALLVVAYLMLLLMPSVDLSSWEPFHAYLFRIAGWGSFGLAIATLGLAAVIPMGYCRLGCPTGRLIDYLRRSATSHKIGKSDWVVISLLLIAVVVRQLER
jgi:NosR/NirI family transcriptional regulator, nitrous oxide reductase regulator